MKKLSLSILLLCTACIQSSLGYVKAPSPKPLFSIDQILRESGLIEETASETPNRPTAPPYPSALVEGSGPAQSLQVIGHTLETPVGSTFALKVNTQNRYVAALFYAGAGFIYLENESAPAQGRFIFQAGDRAGEIRVRLYYKDGRLYSEEKWFIEVR